MEERLWRTDNSPIGYLYFRLYNNAFIYHPYHWTPIGFKNDIENWTIEDIKSFHKTYYQPSNAVIVVAGDIEAKEVFEKSEKYFGKITRDIDIPTKYQIEPKQDGAKRVHLTKDSEVDMVAIAYKIPPFNHEDQVALSAISALLSSGKSSRLYKLLIDEKKLANQIYAYNMETKDPNLFIFIAVCNPDVDAEDVEKEILNAIDELKNGDISEQEITKLKTNTRADFIYSLESSSTLADLFGSYIVRGDLSPLLDYEKNINNLDKDRIVEVAKNYFTKATSTTVILTKEHK
jgi:predicted Zn-dependent peptidase